MNVTDIKMCIDNENISFVRDAAEEQLGALLARVQEADKQVTLWKKGYDNACDRIAELERDRDSALVECRDMQARMQRVIDGAEKRIEQARREGYELSKRYADWVTYDEAITAQKAEKDGAK